MYHVTNTTMGIVTSNNDLNDLWNPELVWSKDETAARESRSREVVVKFIATAMLQRSMVPIYLVCNHGMTHAGAGDLQTELKASF